MNKEHPDNFGEDCPICELTAQDEDNIFVRVPRNFHPGDFVTCQKGHKLVCYEAESNFIDVQLIPFNDVITWQQSAFVDRPDSKEQSDEWKRQNVFAEKMLVTAQIDNKDSLCKAFTHEDAVWIAQRLNLAAKISSISRVLKSIEEAMTTISAHGHCAGYDWNADQKGLTRLEGDIFELLSKTLDDLS